MLEDDSNDEVDEIMNLWENLALYNGEIDLNASIFDFVENDDDLATSKEPTIAEIAHLATEEMIEESGDETDENEYLGVHSDLDLRPPPWHSATPNAKGCNFFLKKSFNKRFFVKRSLNIQLRFAKDRLSVGLLVKKLWPLPKSPPTLPNSN